MTISKRRYIEDMTESEILEVERRMRPGNLSKKGFLGKSEKLSKVISKDNEMVIKMGLTHEKIASILEAFLNEYDSQSPHIEDFAEGNKIWDRYIIINYKLSFGKQECPWKENEEFIPRSDLEVWVRKTNTCDEINIPCGVIHLIKNHGFYEGIYSPYRVDPEKIARFFGLVEKV